VNYFSLSFSDIFGIIDHASTYARLGGSEDVVVGETQVVVLLLLLLLLFVVVYVVYVRKQ
tara:strand:+ start:264 stop:443 length:180 start_codon:yes stop_codon:yes gene_type:complete